MRRFNVGSLRRQPWWLLLVLFTFLVLLTDRQTTAQEGEAAGDPAAAEQTPEGAPPAESPGGEGGEGGEGAEPPPPPLSEEQLQQIEDQARGMIDGGKGKAARALLEENQPAVATSPALQNLYLQAVVLSGDPVSPAKRLADELLAQDAKNIWANYVLGIAYTEGKKPDYGKALKHLAVLKALKKPPAGASTLYWKVWARANLYLLLGVGAVLGVGGAAIAKKKRKKAEDTVALSLDDLPAADGAKPAVDGEKPAGDGQTKPESAGKPETDKKLKPAAAKPPAKPAAAPAKASAAPKPPAPPKPAEPAVVPPAAEPEQAKPVIVGGKLVSLPPRPTAVEPAVEESPDDFDLVAAAAVDPAKAAEFSEPVAPAAEAPVTQEIADRWEYLKRKAAAQAIPPAPTMSAPRMAPVAPPQPQPVPMMPAAPAAAPTVVPRAAVPPETAGYATAPVPPMPAAPAAWARSGAMPPQPAMYAAPPVPPVNLGPFPPVLEENGISLDFSPERRQDDLISKLKMLAIEDGELRALLLQKNPAHLPALIEYVMLRPEPVRLAFVARELGHYHDPAVTDVLAQLLYHDDVRVVLAAIQGIQLNADPSGILHVSPFITSPDGILSEAARNALMSFGPAKVLQLYVRELPRNADDRIREGGVFVLSRMKGGAVTNLLVQMLADRSPEVRKKVIMAMTFQKDPQFLPVLREFMKAAPEEEKKLARKAVVYLQGFLPRPGA